jgi:ABC-2 type transport system permease protein
VSEPASSNIYDLGYRRYEGERIGRRGTLLTLYVHGLRSAFGLGRRPMSKIFPFGLAVLAFVPAIIQLGVAALVSGGTDHVRIFKHEDYFQYVRVILVLFCATVAPELIGRDQRSRTLSLYFSRAVSRFDYAFAKFAALTSAMLVLTLGPQLVLFIGNGLASNDLSGYLGDNWNLVLPIFGGALLLSMTIAALGLVIAAYLPRRAYSTATIVGVFILTLSIGHILIETANASATKWFLLASPYAWEGMVRLFFRVDPDVGSTLQQSGLSGWTCLAGVIVSILICLTLTLRRLRRVSI